MDAANLIALVTCQRMPDLYEGEQPLLEALRATGLRPVPAVWSDPSVPWTAFGAVLLRNPWDYFERPAAFTAWLEELRAQGVPLYNSATTALRNANKRYLLELAQQGLPVIPTAWLPQGEPFAQAIAALGADEVVIKPAISGGGFRTRRLAASDSQGIQALLEEIHQDCAALAQPFMADIGQRGELSLIFIEGRYSHAVRKVAAPGQFLIHEAYGGRVEPHSPSPGQIQACQSILEAWGEDCLYARVDVLDQGDDQVLLMELELLEPELFFAGHPRAATWLAEALLTRLHHHQDL